MLHHSSIMFLRTVGIVPIAKVREKKQSPKRKCNQVSNTIVRRLIHFRFFFSTELEVVPIYELNELSWVLLFSSIFR